MVSPRTSSADLQRFQRNILLQILNSKRLLIDHVEILEECLNTFDDLAVPPAAGSTVLNRKLLLLSSFTSAVGSAVVTRPTSGLLWTTTVGATLLGTTLLYGSCQFVLRWSHRCHFRRQQESLARLIQSLEQFELAVRKNVLFRNEYLHGAARGGGRSLDQCDAVMGSLVGNCTGCCVECVRCLHGLVKQLERDVALDERWERWCAPLEAMEFFEQYVDHQLENDDPKLMKDAYNIFAYVQSTCLTRLALSVASGFTDFTLCQMAEVCTKIDNLRNECLKPLAIVTETRTEQTSRPTAAERLPPEVTNLRTLSTALSVKLLATTHRYNQLEDWLQTNTTTYEEVDFKSQLESVEQTLAEIGSELLASEEECQRLLIVVKKLTNKNHAPPLENPSPEDDHQSQSGDATAQPLSDSEPVQVDEFFAVDGTTNDPADPTPPTLDDLAEDINSRIVKRHFRPVLEQLRERIEPIGVEFREREKRALMDKGIRWDGDAANDSPEVPRRRNLYGSDDSEEDGDDDEDGDRDAEKFQRSVERYDDVRRFLAAKAPLNVFGLQPVVGAALDEEVLE